MSEWAADQLWPCHNEQQSTGGHVTVVASHSGQQVSGGDVTVGPCDSGQHDSSGQVTLWDMSQWGEG